MNSNHKITFDELSNSLLADAERLDFFCGEGTPKTDYKPIAQVICRIKENAEQLLKLLEGK